MRGVSLPSAVSKNLLRIPISTLMENIYGGENRPGTPHRRGACDTNRKRQLATEPWGAAQPGLGGRRSCQYQCSRAWRAKPRHSTHSKEGMAGGMAAASNQLHGPHDALRRRLSSARSSPLRQGKAAGPAVNHEAVGTR